MNRRKFLLGTTSALTAAVAVVQPGQTIEVAPDNSSARIQNDPKPTIDFGERPHRTIIVEGCTVEFDPTAVLDLTPPQDGDHVIYRNCLFRPNVPGISDETIIKIA